MTTQPNLFQNRNSVQDERINANFIPEGFLARCLERRGFYPKGWVKRYRNEDPDVTPAGKGWGVFGQREVKFIGMHIYLL